MGGCCFSSLTTENAVDLNESPPPSPPPSQNCGNQILKDGSWPFTSFFLSNLQEATYNFDSNGIVSENGEQSSNVVYRGRLRDLGFVAVKKFKCPDWPYSDYFSEEANRVGKLRHVRIVNLLGYCCEGDERLLVSDFMPNGTLADRLFNETDQTINWSMRFRVAYCIAEALDYCSNSGFESYNNLSAHTILFDKHDEACLSSFGLVKEVDFDPRMRKGVDSGSVAYRFAIVLINLLTGKQITLREAHKMSNEKNFLELMDPKLEGMYFIDEVNAVFKLATYCLEYKSRYNLVAKLESFKTEVESSSSQQQQKLEALKNITKVEVVEEYEDNAISSSQVQRNEALRTQSDLSVTRSKSF